MTPTLSDRLFAFAGRAFAPRMDAAPAAPAAPMRADDLSGATVTNTLSGVGGSRDSGATARPNLQREYLSVEELIALLRGSVYRRIVGLKPLWSTSVGWTISDSTPEQRPLEAAMRRLKLRQVTREADYWARALGESRALLVTDDPAPLSEPLDLRRVKRLHRLEVFDAREFSPRAYNTNVAAGRLGDPTAYNLHPWRPGVTRYDNVHASRLLRFYGDDLPPSERGYNRVGAASSWGADAVGQTLWDGIRHLAQTGSGGARIAQELTVAVFKLASQGGVAGDQRTELLRRLTSLNMMKSIANAVWLSPNEAFERVAANPTGFKDLSDHAKSELALLTGTPLTLLYGLAPGGLSTDGDSWQVAWFTECEAHREDRYREPIERVVEVLYHSEQGGVPDRWDLEFDPMGSLSEDERAKVRLVHTQADAIAVQEGILDIEEVRARYTQPGGFSLELQPVKERSRAAGAPPVVDPAIEESARRLIEQGLGRGAAPRATEPPAAPPSLDAEDRYAVPAGARGNAAKVLRWREEHPDEIEGMTETGWRRARQLATEDTISAADLVEIAAWFARHGEQGATRAVASEFAETPWRDAGYVSWLGWGGDTMAAYAKARRAAMERGDATEGACWIGIPLPEAARAAWGQARVAVESAAGPLGGIGDAPHTTVLYMGQVPAEALDEVVSVARDVAARFGPSEIHAESVAVFPAGTDGTPVVLGVRRGWMLDSIHAELLARLAHLVTKRQHVPYRGHVTLGYAPGELSPERTAAALEVAVPELEWTAARLEVWYGSQVVAVLPLTGRTDAGSTRG